MLGRSTSSAPSARAATGSVTMLPAHLCDARGDAAATVGMRWTTTMMRTTMRTAAVEGTVAVGAGEGRERGGTSGRISYIVVIS